MNILIIGNGFDLAHKLPTKYTDFLDWAQSIEKIGERLDWVDTIPNNMKEAAEWVGDVKQPEEWVVKYDLPYIKSYIDMDEGLREKSVNDAGLEKIRGWFNEHNLKFPYTADMYEEVNSALESDKENKKEKKDNALGSILKAIQDLEENIDCKIDDKAKCFFAIQAKKIAKYEKIVPEQLKPFDVHTKLNCLCKKIFYLMKDNFWLQYFRDKKRKGTWIDFEKEISKVIRKYDKAILKDGATLNILKDIKIILSKLGVRTSDYGETVDRLETDLNRLILLLEIYLSEYVDNMDCPGKLDDIKELKIDRVISFNYTHTFERVYGMDSFKNIQIDYIHGEVNTMRSMSDNNMVLGIDDFPSTVREDEDINFIFFKKYYQMIYKKVNRSYENWIAKIKESGKRTKRRLEKEYPVQIPLNKFKRREKHHIYIFGHSLDITDRDVLCELILNDNVETTIFYRNKEQKRLQIANLDKVIKHEELVRRTGGITETIHFQLQRR